MSYSSKAELRAHFRALRTDFVNRMNEAERAVAFSKAPAMLTRYFTPGIVVAAYIPIGSEADPRALLRLAHDAGCRTALPHVTSRSAPMRFLAWSPGEQLYAGPLGLKQPESAAKPVKPEVILVPLVAYTDDMMRLGQGAGHYDRALSVLPDAFTLGIAWSVQHADFLPTDPWDVPLRAILTEKAWISQ